MTSRDKQSINIDKKMRISLADSYKNLVANISNEHIFYLQIFITVVLGLLILYYLSKKTVRRVSGRSLVLVGGCEAGKTTLLYSLVHDKIPATVTSFKENMATYDCGKKVVPIIDVPGHERVRQTAFDRYKTEARAIAFLLDSATVQANIRDVAEQLFSVLSDATVQNSGCAVAVLCNKQDEDLAKAAPVIERALQREMDVLRETSSNRLASIDGKDGGDKTSGLGKAGEPFHFSHLPHNKVTFIETSVKRGDLDVFKQWMQETL